MQLVSLLYLVFKIIRENLHEQVTFLSATWLSHGPFRATTKGAASISLNASNKYV